MTVPRLCLFLCSILILGPSLLVPGSAPAQAADPLSTVLRERLAELGRVGHLNVRGVDLDAREPLIDFYARRSYRGVWDDPARVQELLTALDGAPADGLNRGDYFPDQLRSLPERRQSEGAVAADRELLASAALLRYGRHRRFGKLDPVTGQPIWFPLPQDDRLSAPAWLEQATTASSLLGFLAADSPEAPFYVRLKQALAEYRAIAAAGGWPGLPSGPLLELGAHDPRVATLRDRLRTSGDLAGPALDPESFDEPLAAAVRHFQIRHGLQVDGRVGLATAAALNVPVTARLDQLRLSLERARWLMHGLPPRFIAVNIPAFRASLAQDGEWIWTSRVIVGQPKRPTPQLQAELRSVIINPAWIVPPTIIREDVLPLLKKDISYLQRENMRVLSNDGNIVDPATVDWKTYQRGIPYSLVQNPGPRNPLGRIKFMFPNSHSVYMHDTPGKSLFQRAGRAFSSGCIRVEDALQLAELVLGDPPWSRAALEQAIAAGTTRTVALRRLVPVMLIYWTAVADPPGGVAFFRDVYGLDAPLLAALDASANLPPQRTIPAPRSTGPEEEPRP